MCGVKTSKCSRSMAQVHRTRETTVGSHVITLLYRRSAPWRSSNCPARRATTLWWQSEIRVSSPWWQGFHNMVGRTIALRNVPAQSILYTSTRSPCSRAMNATASLTVPWTEILRFRWRPRPCEIMQDRTSNGSNSVTTQQKRRNATCRLCRPSLTQ